MEEPGEEVSWKCPIHPYRSGDVVRTMFSIFGQYITRGQIEMDTSLVRSFKNSQEFYLSHNIRRNQGSHGGTR